MWSPVGNRLAIASGAGEVVLWQEDFQETVLQAASGASVDALGFSGANPVGVLDVPIEVLQIAGLTGVRAVAVDSFLIFN